MASAISSRTKQHPPLPFSSPVAMQSGGNASTIMTPYPGQTPAPPASMQQSVRRFAQLADTPAGEISRLLSLSEGGNTPDTTDYLPQSQELQDLADYMKHLSFQTPMKPFDEESTLPPQSTLQKPPKPSDPPRTVFRDRSNQTPPRHEEQPHRKTTGRDPTPSKAPMQHLSQRPQVSLEDLTGLNFLQSPAGSMRTVNQSSLIVEVSHDEQDDEEEIIDTISMMREPRSPPKRLAPLEPDQAQSPKHEKSILLGTNENDELLLSKQEPPVASKDDGEQVEENAGHFFLFDSTQMGAGDSSQPNSHRLSLHLPATPTLVVESQLEELQSKQPQTPQDARQWLRTAMLALQEARNERETARQWSRDMKAAVQKWANEQQRLVHLEASSYLRQTLEHLERLVTDLHSQVNSQHEEQGASQAKLYHILQEQQIKLQSLSDQVSQLHNSNRVNQQVDPSPSAIMVATKNPAPPTSSQPGVSARPPRPSPSDASTSSNRVKRQLPNGAGRLIVYGSGTEKELYKDGTTVVRFPSGDVETKLIDGTVSYFHASEQVMQITQPDQSVLLEYPNGQVERHYMDGSKVILFPNGQKVKVDVRGKVQACQK